MARDVNFHKPIFKGCIKLYNKKKLPREIQRETREEDGSLILEVL